MTIQRTDIYSQLEGNATFDKDIRCCTVVALHAITGKGFEACQKYMAKFGRIHRKGMFRKDWEKALEAMKTYVVKKGPYTKENRITIKKFIDKHPVGRYYCASRGHVFAIIDGVLLDHCDKPRRQITTAYRVYPREEI